MFRLLAPILIVAVSGFASTPDRFDRQQCVDAPAQEVAAYTASLGGGAEVLTSCDAVAASPGGCADPEAKIGCCASCSDPKKANYLADYSYSYGYAYIAAIAEHGCQEDGGCDKGDRR